MTELGQGQIVVELWPSLVEIQTSKEDDRYLGRLTEFYTSVDSLLSSLDPWKVPVEAFTNNHLHKGKPRFRAFPPEIVELAVWLGPSGVALVLYKALKLWVDLKNGRRIKIVDGDLEVEATQFTPEQFIELLEVLREQQERLADRVQLQDTLLQKGFNPVSLDSTERLEDRCILQNTARSRSKQ